MKKEEYELHKMEAELEHLQIVCKQLGTLDNFRQKIKLLKKDIRKAKNDIIRNNIQKIINDPDGWSKEK